LIIHPLRLSDRISWYGFFTGWEIRLQGQIAKNGRFEIMKRVYLVTIIIIFLLGLTGCIAVNDDIPTASEALAARGTPEVQLVPPSLEKDYADGYAFVNESLDAFFIICNKKWEYSVLQTSPISFVFVSTEDETNQNFITVQSVPIKIDGSAKNQIETFWQKVALVKHIDIYDKEECNIGQHVGYTYKWTYKSNEVELSVRYYFWIVDHRLYTMVASSQIDFENDVNSILETMTKTFLTYKEYLKIDRVQ